MKTEIDKFIDNKIEWQDELSLLRTIINKCGLNEELKWKQPCYSFDKKNICIIGRFKEYCALMFFKGALLHDTEHILIAAGKNTQSGRQIRFNSVHEIINLENVIKSYLFEAIEIEKLNLKVKFKTTDDYDFPRELQQKMNQHSDFENAFKNLTAGRQKAYLLYFSEATQSKTRESRIEKYTERILKGKGLHDCVCGLSKKMPRCDGSHKFLK